MKIYIVPDSLRSEAKTIPDIGPVFAYEMCIEAVLRRSALPSGACCAGLVFATLSL